MSYISSVQPDHMAVYTRDCPQQTLENDALSSSVSEPVSAGLEIVVFLTMLSGISLALCTIAAGAFHQPIW